MSWRRVNTPEIQPEKSESHDRSVKSPRNFGNAKAVCNEGSTNNSQHCEFGMVDINDRSNEVDMTFGIPIRRVNEDTNVDLMSTPTIGIKKIEDGPSQNGTRPNNKFYTGLPHSVPTLCQNIFSTLIGDPISSTEHSSNEDKTKKRKRARVGNRSSPRTSTSSISINPSSKCGDIPLSPHTRVLLDLNKNPLNSSPDRNCRKGSDVSESDEIK